jgi:lysophospholipase L1-like esterase
VDELQPDLIFIGIGINDAMRGGKFDEAEFQKSYTTLLDQLDDLAIVLLGNTPIRQGNGPAHHHSMTIDSALKEIAKREECGFFSFTEALGEGNAWEVCQSNGWLKSDGIHFTESGYLALSSMLFDAWQSAFHAHRP